MSTAGSSQWRSVRRSSRFEARERTELRREVLVSPHADLGLVAMNGPGDPEPGLVVEDGRVVEVHVQREELVRLARGLTPARLARVVGMLDPVELMFAMKKLRARRRPANQAH